MLLSSIQIQGFKSFADKTILKFGKGITAVVGPNGSGKSNISDAVRWVLGEQSTKSLRGQSMEDVIFGGTDTRRPHGFCEVTLNIDNTDRTLNFDNDSVSVTRRYYRSHESEYLINNVTVRLKDVHELFMDTGLGRDGYSMIGQGKIDNIISSKSDERRDIFEEASGISKYRYRKTEAERKLSAAEDNLLRLNDIMSELKSRVGPLEVQSHKAEEFLRFSENKKQLEIGLWLYTLNNSRDALRSHESKIANAQLRYGEIEKALADFESENEKNTLEFTAITAEIEAKREEIAEANQKTAVLSGNISVINNDIIHIKESIERLKAEKLQLDKTDLSVKKEINEKQEKEKEIRAAVFKLREQLHQKEEELSNLLINSENISRQIEDEIKNLNTLSARESDLRVDITTADTSVQEITSRVSNISELINSNSQEKQALTEEYNQTKHLLDNIEDKIISCQNSLKGYELRLKSRNETVDTLRSKSEGLHLKIQEMKHRVQILSELESNMEGFSKAVKFVINESDKGTLRGIHGTISKLISVDKKYAVAIETALGNNIQNIVVDSESDAKRAIERLKNSNSGRATFMPISSVTAREFKESGFDCLYGFVGLAADLVKVDKKYEQIIKYLLGGTVITEDIDSAVTLAKKYNYRVKVVSLDGQVVNPGGSLTGGSLVKQAGLLSRRTQIERLQGEIESITEQEKENNNFLNAAVNAAAQVNADISAVSADLTNANEDKIRTLSEIKRIEELISNIDNNVNSLISERDCADEKIASLKNLADTAQKALDEINAQRDELQLKIDSMTGGRDNIADMRQKISDSITELKLDIINDEKDAELIANSARELQSSILDRAGRNKDIDNEIAALSFKIEQLYKEISDTNDDIDNLKQTIEENNKLISSLTQKRNITEKASVDLRSKEREKTMEREKIGGELARLSERRDVMVKEYDDIISQLYDNYQLTKTEAENLGINIEKPSEAKKELAEIKSKIRALGIVNVSAIEEYKEVKERYDFMYSQIEDVEKSKAELHKLINQLTAQMQELFTEGFNKINEIFTKTFRELFGGGTASLRLTDPENVLTSGIDIEARLPGKNVPSLDGLSGGEKALVALSIYFSIMQVNAPPFCFLDEVDTALDDINVDRFADYMKNSKLNTQFICVTHRRGTMEAADMLYGVTMQEKGVTKLLELDVAELEKKLFENRGA